MALCMLLRKAKFSYNNSLVKILTTEHQHISSSLKGAFVRPITLAAFQNCEEKIDAEYTEKKRDPSIDRTVTIPVETSIRYMKSEAYKITYGQEPVWTLYRRNHKGPIAPRKTRKTCIRNGLISTGNPCPICRDEYLVLDHTNVDLLKQFISPYTGEVLQPIRTGLCQKKHKHLLIALERAKDYGYIIFDVPFREYNYSLYYKPKV